MKRQTISRKATGVLLMACLFLFALAPPVSAQESQAQAVAGVKLKSEKKAMTLAIVGTLLPWAVFIPLGLREGHDPDGSLGGGDAIALVAALAIPVGPAWGYFYAGSPGRAWIGIGIRLIGLAGIVGGSLGLENGGDANEPLMKALIVGGICVTAGSYIFDIAGLSGAVRKHNQKAAGTRLNIAPVVAPRSKTLGLQVQISF